MTIFIMKTNKTKLVSQLSFVIFGRVPHRISFSLTPISASVRFSDLQCVSNFPLFSNYGSIMKKKLDMYT